MPGQTQLLMPGFEPAKARRLDPESSKRAARYVERTGIVVSQREQVLEALRRFPGRCTKEIARMAGLDRYMVARRMPELEQMGLARRGEMAAAGERWWPV